MRRKAWIRRVLDLEYMRAAPGLANITSDEAPGEMSLERDRQEDPTWWSDPRSSSPDLSVHDRIEGDQGFQRRSQRVVQVRRRVQIREARHGGAVEREAGYRVAMQGHVIQHHHLHQVGNVVAGGTAGRIDGAVGVEAADLQTQLRVGLHGNRLALGAVNQEIGRRDALIVGGPYTLASAAHRAVDHAVAGERTIAEDIDHDRLADTGRIFQTGADAIAEVQVARLTIHSVARVIVESTHFDGAGRGVAVDDQLHDGSGLLIVGVALELGGAEDAARTHDIRVLTRVNRARAAVRVDRVGCFRVAAACDAGIGGAGTQRGGIQRRRSRIGGYLRVLRVADALHRFQDVGDVRGMGQQCAQLAGAYQPLSVSGTRDRGG